MEPLARVIATSRAATSRRVTVSTAMPCSGLKYGPPIHREIGVGRRPDGRPLEGEILLDQGAQRLFILLPAGRLVVLRILAERDLGQDFLCRSARLFGAQQLCGAKQNAARPPIAILHDPRSAVLPPPLARKRWPKPRSSVSQTM